MTRPSGSVRTLVYLRVTDDFDEPGRGWCGLITTHPEPGDVPMWLEPATSEASGHLDRLYAAPRADRAHIMRRIEEAIWGELA